jgi:hypothetical protein
MSFHPCKRDKNEMLFYREKNVMLFHVFLGKPIKEGKLVIDVKYWLIFPIPVHSETHDICEETTCPASGDFVIAHTQTLPSYTPPVRFSTIVIITLLVLFLNKCSSVAAFL